MANTTNFGWETPDDTDLVKDGAAAMRTLGNAIDTSLVDLKGGTTGQVLAKNSNTDMDFVWSNDASGIPATIIDAKGDLIVGSAADTAARLAVGTNGYVLTADSTATNGIKWAAAAGGGKVLQVVSTTYSTSTSISTTSFTDSGLSLSITPSANTSKILMLATINLNVVSSDGSSIAGRVGGFRGTTEIIAWNSGGNDRFLGAYNSVRQLFGTYTFAYLDSPSTTSSTTYKVRGSIDSGYGNNSTITFQFSDSPSILTLLEIGA